MKCCICGKSIKFEESNNPYGAMWLDACGNIHEYEIQSTMDRCCNECNTHYVIPGRMYKLMKAGEQNGEHKEDK